MEENPIKKVPPPVIKTATVETKPSAFYVQQMEINQKRMTDKEEYEHLKQKIEDATDDGKRELLHKGDLRDLAWQKLSQEGYRLSRNVNPDDPNDIKFVITW